MLALLFYEEARHLISEPFPHRRNPDGTYDSICPRCYRTVDRQLVEADLRAEERVHVSDPVDLIVLPTDVQRQRTSPLSLLTSLAQPQQVLASGQQGDPRSALSPATVKPIEVFELLRRRSGGEA
jgi:hypothetical protein